MKNPTNKRIKELECQLAYEVERNENNCGIADLQIAELEAQAAALTEQRDAVIEAVMGEDYVFGQHEIEDTPTLYEIICEQVEAEKTHARADLQARLAAEEALNVKNAADAYQRVSKLEAELIGMQAEITRLRAGGCARDQHTTQYCGELRSLVTRLTALAEEFQTEETWDGKRNDALRYCAGRLREALGGGEEVK